MQGCYASVDAKAGILIYVPFFKKDDAICKNGVNS